QAIAMGIDKQAIAGKVLQGKVPVADTFVPTASWAFNPNSTKWSYDVQKARQTLEDAGWKVGGGVREKGGQRLSFECVTYAGDVLGGQVQQVIQAQLREIGVELRIQNSPPNVVIQQFADGKYDIKIPRFIFPAEPSYATIFAADRMPPKGVNTQFWDNA